MLTFFQYREPEPASTVVDIDHAPIIEQVVAAIQSLQKDVVDNGKTNKVDHSNIIKDLQTLQTLTSDNGVLLKAGVVSQEQIKGLLAKIVDTIPNIVASIDNLQSTALTQLNSVGALIVSALKVVEVQLIEDWVDIIAGVGGATITVPAGAITISAYPETPVAYIANERTVFAGEQYVHEAQSVDGVQATFKETIFKVPAGVRFQASCVSIREIGKIVVENIATAIADSSVLDAQIEIPALLTTATA